MPRPITAREEEELEKDDTFNLEGFDVEANADAR